MTEWKYVKELRDASAVKNFVKLYSVKISDDLLSILETNNGGRPINNVIVTDNGNEYIFNALYSYNEEDRITIFSVYPGKYKGTSLFPIGYDPAGNDICIDITNENFYVCDHETGDKERIKSFFLLNE